MEVKQAVATAKDYVADLFEDEQIAHVGLEEVKLLGGVWEITIGFSRPWDRGVLSIAPDPSLRSYKVVRIRDTSGEVLSVVNRALDNH